MRPAAQAAGAFEEESSVFPCLGDMVFLARIRLGVLPLGTPSWAMGQVAARSTGPSWYGALALQCASRDDWRCAQSMHEFSAKDIDGHMVNLDKYRWVHTCLVGEAGEKVDGPDLA